MKASIIITQASRTLFDASNVRWTADELLDYVNEGQQAIVLLRPDANAVNATVQLLGGTRQQIPDNGARLLRVTRNMGADGAKPGRAVRECARDVLDNATPDWHYAGAALTVQHFIYDNIDPKRFYVYPCVRGDVGQNAACQVEIIYSAIPARAADANDVLTLTDQYLPPLLDYVLYRAFSKDTSYAGNIQRAAQHLQAFANALQVNMKMEWGATASADPAAGGAR